MASLSYHNLYSIKFLQVVDSSTYFDLITSLVDNISGQPQVQQYAQQYMNQNYPGQQAYSPQAPVHATFDAGARFSATSPPSIPPPPPGVAPTPAQLAAMQGQQVVISQNKEGFWNGSGGAGATCGW